ncbi:MAG: Dps family protein [Beijerinckiaceae bacterium]
MNKQAPLAAAGRPAPAALDTPTDLDRHGIAAVCQDLNLIVADSFALFLKTKNFHWHVSGPHFRDYHLLLDEQASEILASIDPLAERVRKLGGDTLRSIAHIGRIQSIKDNNENYVAPALMLRELMADNQHVVAKLRECHELCDKCADSATASLLENVIDEAEKRIWFLFEASRTPDRAGH